VIRTLSAAARETNVSCLSFESCTSDNSKYASALAVHRSNPLEGRALYEKPLLPRKSPKVPYANSSRELYDFANSPSFNYGRNNQELAHLHQNNQDSIPTAQKLAPRARQTRRSSDDSKPVNQKVTHWSEIEAAPVLATPAESVPHKPYSSAYEPIYKTVVILSFAITLKSSHSARNCCHD
jgi:hypothetical protein